jgi:hypothetical protein
MAVSIAAAEVNADAGDGYGNDGSRADHAGRTADDDWRGGINNGSRRRGDIDHRRRRRGRGLIDDDRRGINHRGGLGDDDRGQGYTQSEAEMNASLRAQHSSQKHRSGQEQFFHTPVRRWRRAGFSSIQRFFCVFRLNTGEG